MAALALPPQWFVDGCGAHAAPRGKQLTPTVDAWPLDDVLASTAHIRLANEAQLGDRSFWLRTVGALATALAIADPEHDHTDTVEAFSLREFPKQLEPIPAIDRAAFAPHSVPADAWYHLALRQSFTRPSRSAAAVFGGSATPLAPLAPSARIVPLKLWKTNNAALRWIVKGMVPAALTFLVGASGSGKTFLAIYLALHVLLGRPFFGRRTTRGKVVWVAAEGAGSLTPRIRAAAISLGIDLAAFEDQLGIVAGIDLADPAAVAAFVAELEPGTELVIVDTLAAATPSLDENSKDMQRALSAAEAIRQRTGGGVLAIAHLGKDATKGIRGWSGMNANGDATLVIERSDDPLQPCRTIYVEKMRDGEDKLTVGAFNLAKVPLGVDADGDLTNSLAVVPTAAPTKRARIGRIETTMIEVLRRAGPTHQDNLITHTVALLPMPEAGKRDTRRQHTVRALENLFSSQLVRLDSDGVALVPQP